MAASAPTCKNCYSTTGESDYVMDVLDARTSSATEQFLHETLFRLPGVTKLRSAARAQRLKSEIRPAPESGSPTRQRPAGAAEGAVARHGRAQTGCHRDPETWRSGPPRCNRPRRFPGRDARRLATELTCSGHLRVRRGLRHQFGSGVEPAWRRAAKRRSCACRRKDPAMAPRQRSGPPCACARRVRGPRAPAALHGRHRRGLGQRASERTTDSGVCASSNGDRRPSITACANHLPVHAASRAPGPGTALRRPAPAGGSRRAGRVASAARPNCAGKRSRGAASATVDQWSECGTEPCWRIAPRRGSAPAGRRTNQVHAPQLGRECPDRPRTRRQRRANARRQQQGSPLVGLVGLAGRELSQQRGHGPAAVLVTCYCSNALRLQVSPREA